MVLVMNGILQQLTEWVNELVRMKSMKSIVTLSDMHRYVSVLLLSDTTRFSFEKVIVIQRQSGCVAPSLEITRSIAYKFLPSHLKEGDATVQAFGMRSGTEHSSLQSLKALLFVNPERFSWSPCIC